MPVQFSCPHCHALLSTAKRKAGQAVPCPQCRIGVLVPPPEARPAMERIAVAPAPSGTHSGMLLIATALLLGGWCFYQALTPAQAEQIPVVQRTEVPQPKTQTVPSLMPVEAVPPEKEVKELPPAQVPLEKLAQPVVAPPLPPQPKAPVPPAPVMPPPATPKVVMPPATPWKQPAVAQAGKPQVEAVAVFPRWTDEELRRELLRTPELRLKQQTAHQLLLQTVAHLRQVPHRFNHATDLMAASQTELAGLPFRKAHDCVLPQQPASSLHALSQRLRLFIQGSTVQDRKQAQPKAARLRQLLQNDTGLAFHLSSDPMRLVEQLLQGRGDVPMHRSGEWIQPSAVPTLTQMLQAENQELRVLLVELLGRVPGEEAAVALTRRAVFDLSREVRTAAVEQLRQRPPTQFRHELLAAFDHPWPPAAFHAAEAIHALKDLGSIPALKAKLEEPEPSLPFLVKADGKESLMVKELVRVNHLANCLMCHAPSFQETDLVRGKVPVAGQPLGFTSGGGYGGSSPGTFIRADITYLQQDFSVMQPVPNPGFWPKLQRFDYLVRLRTPTKADLLRLADAGPAPKLKHNRQDALRLTLRKLDPTFPAREPVSEPPTKLHEPHQGEPPPKLRRTSPEDGIFARKE